MSTPPRLDVFNTTGAATLQAMIKYQYDIDVDLTLVRIVKNVEAGLGSGGVVEDPWASVTAEAIPGMGYYGRTIFKYRTLSTKNLGIDTFRFVLEIPSVPVKLTDVIDAMLLKYGFLIEVNDFGDDASHVMAGGYGDCTVTTADTSLRFHGDWLFSFVAPGTVDLAAFAPNSQDADLSSVATGSAPE